MAAKRFSTDSIRRQGVQKTVVGTNTDQFTNTFSNSTGGDYAPDAASIAFDNPSAVPGAMNSEQFQVAKAFFMNKGNSEPSAISMALLMLDVAATNGTSVMKVLDDIKGDDKLLFSYATYVQMNIFRQASGQQGILVRKENKDSLKNHLIRP